jgi:1-acyl-sn-glycerol-3-phosphate acyltransferase
MKREAGQIQTVAKGLMSPFFRFLWRIRTEGLDNIPSDGGALIAPNHLSVLDSFFVPLVVGRRITYVGKAEYLDDWKTKKLFPAMGMIPIDRSGGDSAARALDASAGVLDSGELFGIYPEGTRSRSGDLHKGHTGVARLALRTGCPIVPVGIVGAAEVQPPDAKRPKPFREVLIRFGPPIDVTRYQNRSNDRLVLRQITDELMYEIRKLSGQHYVDGYATKTHESIPTEPSEQVLPHLEVETRPSPDDEAVDAPRSSADVLQSRPLVDLNF